MPTADDQPYHLAKADPVRDRQRVLDFWQRTGFSSPDRPRQYDWLYLNGPAGMGRIYLLLHGPEATIVGTACAGTRLIRFPDGRMLRGGVLVDFVVDPAHRSVGPALKLQRWAREQEWSNADVLYGIPDTKAVPVFKRLGADAIVQIHSYVHVLRTGHYLARHIPAPLARAVAAIVDPLRAMVRRIGVAVSPMRATWLSTVGDLALDSSMPHAAQGRMAAGDRGRDFLNWRFDASAWRGAQLAASDGTPAGYIICHMQDGDLHIGDLQLPQDPVQGPQALRAFLELAWHEGVRAVRLDLAGDAAVAETLRKAGMLRRGERTCFVMRNPALPQADLPAAWWFTRADEDV